MSHIKLEANQTGGKLNWGQTKLEAAWLPCPGHPLPFARVDAAVVTLGTVLFRWGLVFKINRLVDDRKANIKSHETGSSNSHGVRTVFENHPDDNVVSDQ